jgi:hypothetical protein
MLKKSFEKGVEINGEVFYKKSEPHKASVTGDTVGDPFKDTSGPSMNILIKLMSIVSLIIAPYIAGKSAGSAGMQGDGACCKDKKMSAHCDMSRCANMSPEQCAAYCDSLGCSAEGRHHCMSACRTKCDMSVCVGMSKEQCATYCDSMQCSSAEKAHCMGLYGEDGKYKGPAHQHGKACCAPADSSQTGKKCCK